MRQIRWRRRRDSVSVAEQVQRSNPVRAGIILVVVLAIGVYFGFAKHIPYTHGFRLNAAFSTAVNIEPNSPVRIAGVAAGKVSSVKRVGDMGLVAMEISKDALPIHSDAELKIRPRIFLEGNFFVELQPGTPSDSVLKSGATIPVTQTADPVQIDQVLTALNTETRANLQHFLAGYGEALTAKPTAAENGEQQPEVRNIDGAQALNKAYRRGVASLRGNAIVSQALGGTEQHDLSKLVAGLQRVTSALNVHEQVLGEWVSNFNTFLGELADQSSSLKATVARLPSALATTTTGLSALTRAFPSIRAFATDLVPGVQQTPSTIAAAMPWIEQVKASLSSSELGGVAKALKAAAPPLAKLTDTQTPFQHQTDLLSKCLTKVVFPAGNIKVQDGANTSGVQDYKEFWYAMAGLAGIGQSFDGNGLSTTFLVGGGGETFLSAPVTEITPKGSTPESEGRQLVARSPLKPEGTSPKFPETEPPYKPLVPCYNQKVPDVNGPLSHGPADGSDG